MILYYQIGKGLIELNEFNVEGGHIRWQVRYMHDDIFGRVREDDEFTGAAIGLRYFALVASRGKLNLYREGDHKEQCKYEQFC